MPPELKFSADESVEKRIVMALRKKYEVMFVDETMKGAEDTAVLQNAEGLKTILLTADKDFGELVTIGKCFMRALYFTDCTAYRLKKRFH